MEGARPARSLLHPRAQLSSEPATDFSLDTASVLAAEEHEARIAARSPWSLAWRRLRRNKLALASFVLFLLIVALSLSAPLYADHVAGTGPNRQHITEQVVVNGKSLDVLSKGGTYTDPDTGELKLRPAGIPIGPQWWHADGKFVLGADTSGRDVAVRLLYGGVNSLKVGIGSALICVFLAVVLALLAGYYGGWVDTVIARFFDIIWAFPVILLAIALGTALALGGLHIWKLQIAGTSLWIPTLVISYVLIPYVGRPLRGQILSLREKEFIEAAVAQGAGARRIMFGELLPNVASTILVFFTLIIANNILLEAALSFLGAGIRPPNPSWGALIQEGQSRLETAPSLTIIPGIAIVLTVVSLNIFGDGLRDALDPRAKVRIEH